MPLNMSSVLQAFILMLQIIVPCLPVNLTFLLTAHIVLIIFGLNREAGELGDLKHG